MLAWRRREIENYLCSQAMLEAYAQGTTEGELPGPVFASKDAERRVNAMRESIGEVQSAMETLGKGSPWSADAKVSDEFLTPLFTTYFAKLGLPNLMSKSAFHTLAGYIPLEEIAPEVSEKLDAIADVAESVDLAPLP